MTNRPTKCKAAFMHGPFDLRIEELELPPVKIHCSILAEDAIKAAIADYKSKREAK